MARSLSNAVLDAALSYIKSNATRLTICNAQPTTYALATNKANASSVGYVLASVTISSADFGSPADNTLGGGGRMITVTAQSSISIDGLSSSSTSSATHVALVKVASSALIGVTTCTTQQLVGGNKVNTPAFSFAIKDPTAP